MPSLITARPATDLHEDARIARAWAAFAREDTVTSAPVALEARVLQAARSAIAERRRAEAERQRRRWLAGTSTIAASMLAAAAWCLSVLTPPAVTNGGAPAPARAAATPAGTAASTASPASTPPMTNVEAGRILATPPHALLASRPLFDAADTGVISIRNVPRAHAYHAPIVEPVPYARTQGTAPARSGAHPGAAPPAAVTAPAPDAWAIRETTPLFDPDTVEPVAPAPLADQKAGGALPRDVPPPQPKP